MAFYKIIYGLVSRWAVRRAQNVDVPPAASLRVLLSQSFCYRMIILSLKIW